MCFSYVSLKRDQIIVVLQNNVSFVRGQTNFLLSRQTRRFSYDSEDCHGDVNNYHDQDKIKLLTDYVVNLVRLTYELNLNLCILFCNLHTLPGLSMKNGDFVFKPVIHILGK